jgi:hypothetical protein
MRCASSQGERASGSCSHPAGRGASARPGSSAAGRPGQPLRELPLAVRRAPRDAEGAAGGTREGGALGALLVLRRARARRGLPRAAQARLPRFLLGQAELVEQDLADNDRSTAVAVHTPDALAEALRGERVTFIHCVEGGFHLGSTPTNAVPFLSDRLYRWFFPQPDEGLSELGRTAVRAMLRPLTGRHVHISNATRSTPFGRRPIPCRPGLARLGSPCAARMSGRLSATACHPPPLPAGFGPAHGHARLDARRPSPRHLHHLRRAGEQRAEASAAARGWALRGQGERSRRARQRERSGGGGAGLGIPH